MARERASDSTRLLPRESAPGLSIAELRQIIALMKAGEVQEIHIERETTGLTLHLRKPTPGFGVQASAPKVEAYESADTGVPAPRAEANGANGANGTNGADGLVPVTAPFVGRYHTGGNAGVRSSLKAGDTVKQGQVIGAIETLNVLREVEAAQAGRVAEVKAHDGNAVEYGQVLMLIEPE